MPLAEPLEKFLSKIRKENGKILDIDEGTLSSLMRKFVKKLKLKDVSFHTLRHTFASHLAMQGVDLYTIAKLLGHSDIKTTEIYAHLSPYHFQDVIKKLPY
ncbi:MAG: tyrosine-type recombinase/integrase [Endomicrobiia bacterium]